MNTVFWQWATIAVWTMWIGVYWQGGYAFVRAARRRSAPGEDSRSGIWVELLIGGASATVLLTGLLIGLGVVATSEWTRTGGDAVGFCLSLAACLGSFVVRFGFLRRWWSAKITLLPDHVIVDRGPYAVIRHPLYALAVLTYVGAALVFPRWWIVLACAAAAAGYVLLAKLEDGHMAKHLAGYASYQARVRFVMIPGLW